jgi:hypothetical protein
MDTRNDAPGLNERSRPPTAEDLVSLARELNEREVKYIVVGGFAMSHAGYDRATFDIEFLLHIDELNSLKALEALQSLPENAVSEIEPHEIGEYGVVRVFDEITVDLMAFACGIDYESAKGEIVTTFIDGVPIPFASPRLLWWMKQTYREKDKLDLIHLEKTLTQLGQKIPPGKIPGAIELAKPHDHINTRALFWPAIAIFSAMLMVIIILVAFIVFSK